MSHWSDFPCDPWLGAQTRRGYGWRYYKGRSRRAHQAEWIDKRGPVPEGLEVCHHCDNRLCREINHLFLGTHADNMRDMANKGRSADTSGELNPNAKLSDGDIAIIRQLHSSGTTNRELAQQFSVSQCWVSKIVNGKVRV